MSTIAVIGAGPAGLMAADVLSGAGHSVTLFDRMPSAGRKLLMAGRGGLNLTHSEDLERLLGRYGPARPWLEPHIRAFSPDELRAFAHALGEETFVGTSGRVFPKRMKASPLLRAWLIRLGSQGVTVRLRHRWTGGEPGALTFHEDSGREDLGRDGADQQNAERETTFAADAVVLALGGGSWPRLGSDGGWVSIFDAWGIETGPLVAANCGVLVPWSDHFISRHHGEPLKRIRLSANGTDATGEAVVTRTGLEGGVVYAVSGDVRRMLQTDGAAKLTLDLRVDLTLETLTERLARPRRKQSTASWLRKAAGLPPVAIALLHEAVGRRLPDSPAGLAAIVKALPLQVTGLAAMDRAISTAGGVLPREIAPDMMLIRKPGVFVAGEMIDWDAPTGGYLLQACFATGYAAGHGMLRWLAEAKAD